ncbi:hypothetical protein [Chamaesiphon sp.]|uniref:hypothetical protein n=1 Tax=Chamaesiphon sp. TaxID=2814140 RepID=UPI003592FDC7
MSPAEHSSSQAKADQAIETIYTTVEAQPDRTDWLTVVSNLRQVNRQLVEEIARLEQALASAKQTLHTHKEQNQHHEITILQQQDELSIAHDRVGALFQQLETSHQIGQRQQTLIETLSQQLEIVQTIVPQIEAEHEQLRQKYQQQSQKLIKTEQVAIALHRRLKLQTNPIEQPTSTPAPATIDPLTVAATSDSPSDPTVLPTTLDDADLLTQHTATETIASAQLKYDLDLAERSTAQTAPAATPALSHLVPATTDSPISTTAIDPAPPLAPVELPQRHSSLPTLAQTTILSPSKPADPASWREAIATNNATIRYNSNLDPVATPPQAAATVDPEGAALSDPATATAANWPAPTLDRTRTIAKPVKIDLPKFPKKSDS